MKNANRLILGVSLSVALAACGGTEKKTEEKAETKEAPKTEEKAVTQELPVNPAESKVIWSGEVLGVYEHTGKVDVVEGNLEIEGNQVNGGSFVVDLRTMTPTDENYKPEEGKSKEKLVEHLSSDDFFDVKNHPKSTFEIISHDPSTKTLKGNLTVRGVTNEETVTDVNVDLENNTASGKLTFDRKKYDVAFTHPAQDVVISDDVHLEVKLAF
jgi:polyisoprenoid-binding protein YceI